jgi:hypothetical protein
LAGAVASRAEASVLAESVSMSHARSGAKKFRVATSLGDVCTAADAAVGTPPFKSGQSRLCCAARASGLL